MGMRRMKTVRDVPIRKTAVRSFVTKSSGPTAGQTARIRSGHSPRKGLHASDLRSQIIASLPERQKRLLMKMPARKREKLLVGVEKKIDRRMKKYMQSVENDPKARRTIRSARQAEKKLQDAEVRRKIEDTVRVPVRKEGSASSLKEKDARALQKQMKGAVEEALRTDGPALDATSPFRERVFAGRGTVRGIPGQAEGNQTGSGQKAHNLAESNKSGIRKVKDFSDARKDQEKLSPSARRIIQEETVESLGKELEKEGRPVFAPSSGKPGKAWAAKQAEAGKILHAMKGGKVGALSIGAAAASSIAEKGKASSTGPSGKNVSAEKAAPAVAGSQEPVHLSPDQIRMEWEAKGQAKALYYKELTRRVKKQYRRELFHSLGLSQIRDSAVRKMKKKMQQGQAEGSAGRELVDSTQTIGDILSAGGRAGKAAKKTSAAIKEALNAIRKSVRTKAWAALGGTFLIVLIPILLILLILVAVFSGVSTSVSAITQDDVYSSVEAGELIAYAESWVGITKYAWGAGRAYETDWQDYTDCSGFVHGVFSHFGYEIGGDTCQMETSAGHVVGTDSVQNAVPGDILLWFHDAGCSAGNSYHVSIYIGDGKMVHCTAGGNSQSRTPSNPGIGVIISNIWSGSHFQVRRILTESLDDSTTQGGLGGRGTGGHRIDATPYTQSEMELIWAIVAQEDNGSYAGALAVISTAMNRVESPKWSYEGSNALAQLKAPGQFCYSNDNYWRARLGGNVPQYVKQAVYDCLKKGIRNHTHTSFRSHYGSNTPGAEQIGGGNWYFD
jgi:cell wall-associated NlpC family hydrolase